MRNSRDLLSLFLAMLLAACGAAAQEEEEPEPKGNEKLPKLSDMKVPEAETLLRKKPVDWVVLRNEDTLVVEPVSPRPDTLAKMDEELKRLGSVKAKNTEENEALKQRRKELLKLQVTLIKGAEDDPDFVVDTKVVKQIVYHEDHVLQRAELCLEQGQTGLAFELLVYLDRRHHNWPGYARIANRLLLKEAQIRLERDDAEGAWRFAEELYGKQSDFTGLATVAGRAVDRLATIAVEDHDYRRARHFLRRLAARDAQHSVYEKWRTELSNRTTVQMDAARAAAAQGEAAQANDIVDQAARIWPDTPGLKDLHRELTNRYQILRVGVLDLPTEPAPYPFATRAQERWQQLTSLSWFEVSRFDDNGPRYRSVPCESWEPADLGRELRFAVRRDRAESDTRPRMTSATLIAELTSRLDANSLKYDERLASNVLSVATPSPFEVVIRFRRPPMRPEALFRMPLTAAAEDRGLNADLSDEALESGQRFRMLDAGEENVRAVRIRPEPATIKQRHVAEIVEKKYADWDSLLQGLLRGEIFAVANVAPIDQASLKDDTRFFMLPYAQPVSHVIQFHPQSAPLKNGQLRRALLHAIPRQKILDEQILPGVPAETAVARLSASPFTIATAEHNRLLPQPDYEPILSAGLTATARKELGGSIPPLRIAFPPDAEIRRAVDAMIANWKRVGIEVIPIDSLDKGWDLAYRTMRFREPVVELWPFLTLDASSSVASLSVFPERLRRQLLEMERTTNWAGAIQVLHRLQADLLVDAWWIPLWELDEFCLFRRNVTGLPEKFVNPYQDVERWVVQSWYPTENP